MMKSPRPALLAIAMGISICALSSQAAWAQFTPDFPTGGTCATPAPSGDRSTGYSAAATVLKFDFMSFFTRLNADGVVYGWLTPVIRRPVGRTSSIVSSKRRTTR